MAYFLKKTNNKKGTYLQIYESFYDPKRRQTAHKSYKPIGYVHELIENGIDDPIAYYKGEVSELNKKFHAEKNEKKVQKIADKECVDDFPYTITDPSTGRKTTVKLREKRVVIFNPKLAQKQIFEINREVEKAKLLKASQAKKSEYRDCAKYVTFSSTDKNGNETDLCLYPTSIHES